MAGMAMAQAAQASYNGELQGPSSHQQVLYDDEGDEEDDEEYDDDGDEYEWSSWNQNANITKKKRRLSRGKKWNTSYEGESKNCIIASI